MSLKYSFAYQERGIDQYKIFDIDGEFSIDVADVFRARYDALGIKVQQRYDNPGLDATYFFVFRLHYVVHLVIKNYENLPFGSTPEERFKLGSYSFISRYVNTTDSEGNVTSTPLFTPPNFIVYPRFSLPAAFCVMNPSQPSYVTYNLGLDVPEVPPIPVSLIQLDTFLTKGIGGTSLPGVKVNLTDGLLADMMIEYSYLQVNQNSPDYPTYVSII